MRKVLCCLVLCLLATGAGNSSPMPDDVKQIMAKISSGQQPTPQELQRLRDWGQGMAQSGGMPPPQPADPLAPLVPPKENTGPRKPAITPLDELFGTIDVIWTSQGTYARTQDNIERHWTFSGATRIHVNLDGGYEGKVSGEVYARGDAFVEYQETTDYLQIAHSPNSPDRRSATRLEIMSPQTHTVLEKPGAGKSADNTCRAHIDNKDDLVEFACLLAADVSTDYWQDGKKIQMPPAGKQHKSFLVWYNPDNVTGTGKHQFITSQYKTLKSGAISFSGTYKKATKGLWDQVAVPAMLSRLVEATGQKPNPSDPPPWPGTLEMSWNVHTKPIEGYIAPCDPDTGSVDIDGYKKWIPEAGDDEKAPGNAMAFVVAERQPGTQAKPLAAPRPFRARIQLAGVSHEPGISMNQPARDRALKTSDLRFDPALNPDFDISDEGQIATSKSEATSHVIHVSAYDYGAYGTIKAKLIFGQDDEVDARVAYLPSKGYIDIPCDENHNHVADQWERDHEIFQKNLPADWDGVDTPGGQKADGDGFPLYERYRGFRFDSEHERLNPNSKYLCVYDPDGIVRRTCTDPDMMMYSFDVASQVKLRFVDGDEWTGPGSANSGKRVVNFNKGTGFVNYQTALHVSASDAVNPPHEFGSRAPTVPAGWQDMRRNDLKSDSAPRGLHLGFTFPDVESDLGSPSHVYEVIIYPGMVQKYLLLHSRRHFANQQYYKDAVKAIDGLPELPANLAEAANAGFPGKSDEWVRQVTQILVQLYDAKQRVEQEADGYRRDHPDQFSKAVDRYLVLVTAHEMGHAVGVAHHAPYSSEGDHTCVMRTLFPETDGCPEEPADPYDLKFYPVWPNRFCADCWKQIIVTDRLDPGAK